MTPNGDEDILPYQNRARRLKPLPLCLSDNDKNMPVLTVITTEENFQTNVRNRWKNFQRNDDR